MRHHKYSTQFPFVHEPVSFDKYSDLSFLRYCLGATMYMPGVKDFARMILNGKYPGLTSMAICFEDACREEDVPAAEENTLRLLDLLNEQIDEGELLYEDLPLIALRVRSPEQFRAFGARLKPGHLHLIAAFNFPKFNTVNGEEYLGYLEELNLRHNERVYAMPILEDRKIAYAEIRLGELTALKKILDGYKQLILNVRVGGTDFSSCFGVRRGMNYTIYDIMTVRECLADILNIFTRNNDYSVSGPVWEYFRVKKDMKFEKLPERINESMFKGEPLIDDASDGLLRELFLDRANGFIGKTIIHPTHIPFVNGIYAVTREAYEDALQITEAGGGVVKSKTGNKMNEINPHRSWAEKILMRGRAYGVINNEACYRELFIHGSYCA